MVNAVLKEIQEREDFLKDMEALGKADLYRNKIQTEISQVYIQLLYTHNTTELEHLPFLFRKYENWS